MLVLGDERIEGDWLALQRDGGLRRRCTEAAGAANDPGESAAAPLPGLSRAQPMYRLKALAAG